MKLKQLIDEHRLEASDVMDAIEKMYPDITIVSQLTDEQEEAIRNLPGFKSSPKVNNRIALPGSSAKLPSQSNRVSAEQESSSENVAEAAITSMMAGVFERLRQQIDDAKEAEMALFELVKSYLESGGVYPPGLSPEREKVVSDLARLLIDEEIRVTNFRGHLPVRIRISGADVALEPFVETSEWQLNAGGSSLVPHDSLLLEAQVSSAS